MIIDNAIIEASALAFDMEKLSGDMKISNLVKNIPNTYVNITGTITDIQNKGRYEEILMRSTVAQLTQQLQ